VVGFEFDGLFRIELLCGIISLGRVSISQDSLIPTSASSDAQSVGGAFPAIMLVSD
jgi:hypothetical protein